MVTNLQTFKTEYNRSQNYRPEHTEERISVTEDDFSKLLEDMAKEMEQYPRAYLIY